MSRRVRRVVITSFAVLAGAVGLAALAWACTPSAYIAIGPGSGAPGSSATVTGKGFVPGPVDIRWNGAALATATGPSFSVDVTIPSASPGVYYIQATATAEGTVAGQASRAFRVSGAPAGVAAPSPAGSAPAASAPAPAREKRAATQRGRGGSRSRGESRSGGARQRTSSKASQRSPILTTRSGVPAFRDSVPGEGTRARAAGRATGASTAARAGRRPDRGPSARTASSDLWSGFRANAKSATLPSVSGPAGSPGSELIPGVALLAMGILALMGGAGLATARRRRRRATTGR